MTQALSKTDPGESPRQPLAVTRLALSNFRSYERAELSLGERPVVLAGPNGAGKTNLLDAISLLSPGRGLRGAPLSEHTRKAPQAAQPELLWAVAATVARGAESYDIGTGLVAGGGAERREVRLNGAPVQNSAELGEIVRLAWLTPAMDRLFAESASGRRRFLDRLVLGFEPGHATVSLRYERAMRERARLLRLGPRDAGWLSALEKEMAESGIAIAAARARVMASLNAELARRERAGAFPAAQLRLEGETDRLAAETGERAPDRLRQALEAARIRDAESRRTTVGPHLSDLCARHTAKRMEARDCSTGEQKALLISIVLANAWECARRQRGHAPLLLLDEIAAHLDGRRRAALFEEILALGAQAWLTGTDVSLFENLGSRADIFTVEAGRFARHN